MASRRDFSLRARPTPNEELILGDNKVCPHVFGCRFYAIFAGAARTFPETEAGLLQFRITRGRFRRRGVL